MRLKSFTLLEVVLVVAILVVLAASVIPIVKQSIEDTKVTKVIDLSEVLKHACKNYRIDVNRYPIEIPTFPAPVTHGLSQDDSRSGWKGPYISSPLAPEDNPYFDGGAGAGVAVFSPMLGLYAFDVDGNGVDDRTGAGSYVIFYNVSQSAAKNINDILDSHLGNNNWQARGRVEYSIGPTNTLLTIYLIGGVRP